MLQYVNLLNEPESIRRSLRESENISGGTTGRRGTGAPQSLYMDERMKVGIQTIGWGEKIGDIKWFCQNIADIGYEGVEFDQKVGHLGPPQVLRDILADHSLVPAGLSRGQLPATVQFAAQLCPEYLCSDEFDEIFVRDATEAGLTVALHPHYLKDLDSLASTVTYLKRSPQLRLILDTAHQHLIGEDIIDALHKYGERVAAVHMKDWTNRYGMSPIRFSRGFATLGEGCLQESLERTVEYLKYTGFTGWLIVEQDSNQGNPLECARISRRWLERLGV